MKAKSKIMALSLPVLFLFSENTLAKQVCIKNAIITAVEVGYIQNSGGECPDNGNCIRFEYRNNIGGLNASSGYHYVKDQMNLNDGQKGMAFYDILVNAMINNYTVEASSSTNECLSKYRSVNTIKLYGY
jgi:hypothetical protein